MYVDEIILQGFKTYMNRTVISGFDKQFNAITGLNGSGKSNILDAIQFLLGSTSKQMLRLKTGLTQLIYKEGFAGIQRASVTIKFKCPDKNMRPTGYENQQQLNITRQITKDRISKFFINGNSLNLTKLKNLFRSVQLNIQNPHFLVKQGQITKIINLKPLQLLSMVQETAGTAYYNKTRTESQKIIQRKQQKLISINEILQSTIKPQMQKFQLDRKRYAAYKDKQALCERLNQKIKRYEFNVKFGEIKNKEGMIASIKQKLSQKDDERRRNLQRMTQLQGQIAILRKKSENSAIFNDYNTMKKLLIQKENQKKTIKTRLQKIQEEFLKLQQDKNNNQRQLENLKKDLEWHEKTVIQAQKQKQQFQDLLAQMKKSTNQAEATALMEKQLKQEEAQVLGIQNQIRMMIQKKQNLRKQSQNQNKFIEQAKQNTQILLKNLNQVQLQIQSLQHLKKPASMQDPDMSNAELRKLQSQKDRIMKQNFRLNFYFNNPNSNFDRKLVRGKMFMVFKAKDKIYEKALQIGCGGKLFNVIIDNQQAAQTLVQNESFGNNVTLIPNNKIRSPTLKKQTIDMAYTVASQNNGFAKPAYELIDYPQDLRNSIMFGFGNFIICSTSAIANKIAFHPNKQLACRCVTFDGDILQSGTMTGGSDNSMQFIIPKYNILRQIEQKMISLRKNYDSQRKMFQQYQKQMNEYKLKERDLQNKLQLKEKIKQKISSLGLNTKPKDYIAQISDIEKKIEILNKQRSQHHQKVVSLQEKTKKGSMKSLEQQKKQILNDQKKCQKKLADEKKAISICQVQIQRLINNIKIAQNSQRDLQKQIIDLQKVELKVIDNIKENKIKFQELQTAKIRAQKQIHQNQQSLQIFYNEFNEVKKAIQNHDFACRNLQLQMEAFAKQISQAQRYVRQLIQNHPWLESQRNSEIQEGFNYSENLQAYNKAILQIDKLKKTVKMNVDDHSYQKLHEQYNNLLQKKGTLQNDKKTLISNMHELDEKRTKTLQKCFADVKINLSSIFNDLLPGATAHLNLIDPYDVTKGAELQVHFNGVKKQLRELSGGQRSLLALSFILALLLYKPSPFYILDQIDSALDLSHTQNIGYMISKRFPQSQFILISLKEGMFQNANVLYKVHFSQGESKVDRQVLKKQSQNN